VWRSAFAIVVGFVIIGVLSFATDALVRLAVPNVFDAHGGTESVPVLLAALGYVALFATGGCYLTARLAPSHPMRHALVLGGLGLAFNVAGTIAMWSTAPAWYHAVALAMVMPLAWAGGHLRERQLRGPGTRTLGTA
jgi:hypothetical protein